MIGNEVLCCLFPLPPSGKTKSMNAGLNKCKATQMAFLTLLSTSVYTLYYMLNFLNKSIYKLPFTFTFPSMWFTFECFTLCQHSCLHISSKTCTLSGGCTSFKYAFYHPFTPGQVTGLDAKIRFWYQNFKTRFVRCHGRLVITDLRMPGTI